MTAVKTWIRWGALMVLVLTWLNVGCASPATVPALTPSQKDVATASMTRTRVSTSTRPLATQRPSPTPTRLVEVHPATATPTPAATATRSAPTPAPLEMAAAITLTLLYDNNRHDERLETAWGFACLVEGLEQTILFDTGGGDLLLRNMRALAIDPDIVDVVVLSHIHSDHVGGLSGFLRENHDVMVYLPASFPRTFKSGVTRTGARLTEISEPVEICAGASTTGELGTPIKEQALIVESSAGPVVITGCAHPGITHIVRQATRLMDDEIFLVIGGFHLGGVGAAELDRIVGEFQQLGVEKAAPCHCSGDAARRRFAEAYGADFIPAGVGLVLTIGAGAP
ncbi:MAG: MBL fold metallo-hydrolase [Anaerolineae bacterium]